MTFKRKFMTKEKRSYFFLDAVTLRNTNNGPILYKIYRVFMNNNGKMFLISSIQIAKNRRYIVYDALCP